jgi:membrane protease YdiL (CAAX protease family)
VLFIVLVVIEEWLSNAWGLSKPEPWSVKYHGITKVIRVVALVLIAPISEELVFRGMLYHLLSTTPLRDVGAILITALVFAAFHYQYSAKEGLLILGDGLFFGIVRYSTGSTLLTIALHMLGNSYAAYQRLFVIVLR